MNSQHTTLCFKFLENLNNKSKDLVPAQPTPEVLRRLNNPNSGIGDQTQVSTYTSGRDNFVPESRQVRPGERNTFDFPTPPLPGARPTFQNESATSGIVSNSSERRIKPPGTGRHHGIPESASTPRLDRQLSHEYESIPDARGDDDSSFQNEKYSWENESATFATPHPKPPQFTSPFSMQEKRTDSTEDESEASRSRGRGPSSIGATTFSTTSSTSLGQSDPNYELIEISLPETFVATDTSVLNAWIQFILNSMRTNENKPIYKNDTLVIGNKKVTVAVHRTLFQKAKKEILSALRDAEFSLRSHSRDGQSELTMDPARTYANSEQSIKLKYMNQIKTILQLKLDLRANIKTDEQLKLLFNQVITFFERIQSLMTEGYLALISYQFRNITEPQESEKTQQENRFDALSQTNTNLELAEYSANAAMSLAGLQMKIELIAEQRTRIKPHLYNKAKELFESMFKDFEKASKELDCELLFMEMERISNKFQKEFSSFSIKNFVNPKIS